MNTDIFRELFPDYTNLFRVHIKPYRHFQRFTTKQWSTFSDLYQTILTLSKLLQNNTTYFFQSSLQTTNSQLLPHNTTLFSDLISNKTDSEGFYKIMQHTFPEVIT